MEEEEVGQARGTGELAYIEKPMEGHEMKDSKALFDFLVSFPVLLPNVQNSRLVEITLITSTLLFPNKNPVGIR